MEAKNEVQIEVKKKPAALMLAEKVELVEVEGRFDETSQTWSDRKFECAGAKKHNEAM